MTDEVNLPHHFEEYTVTTTDVKPLSGDYNRSFILSKKDDSRKILWFENSSDTLMSFAYYANELVAKLKPSVDRNALNRFLENQTDEKGNTIAIADSLRILPIYLLKIASPDVVSLNEWTQKLGTELFEYIEPNSVVWNQVNQFLSPFNVQQWNIYNNGIASLGGGKFDADADAIEAISKIKFSRLPKYEVVVSIIDSGIDATHPSLIPVLWTNINEIPNNNIDDDNNGYIDDIHGYNFASNNNNITDYNSHGTHVSGIVAGNPTGSVTFTGVAPEANILTAKYAEGGFGDTFAAIKGIEYSVNMKAHVINMSFGSYNFLQHFFDAVNLAADANITLIAAAGNDGIDVGLKLYYPACYPRVIAVASTNKFDSLSSFSNYQTAEQYRLPLVQISAPGENIWSTLPGQRYGMQSGTSMAAPHVAGAVALFKTIYPNSTLTDILRRIQDGADVLPHLQQKIINGRRLNIYKSLFQPFQTYDQNGTAYKNQIVLGQARSVWYPYANSSDPQIDGSTYEKAFKIASMKQLVNIRDEDLEKHFVLTNNISWHELQPVDRNMINKRFNGVIYGNGYTIQNFDLKKNGPVALFRELGEKAAIVNLRFSEVDIKGKAPVGTIATVINGSVLNDIQVEGSLNGERMTGGFVGIASGAKIVNCYFEGEIKTTSTTGSIFGGLVGEAKNGTLLSRNHIQAKINGNRAGGAVGSLIDSRIDQTYSNIDIMGTDTLGGLVGYTRYSEIENCYSEGNVKASRFIGGGAVGQINKSTVNNLYSLAFVESGKYGGGLLARGFDFHVANSYFNAAMGPVGVGGIPKSMAELRNSATYPGWFTSGNSWTMPQGYSPALSFIPRSITSLY